VPLHPVSIVDHVLEEYRSFLQTEFRARDPKLRAALEEALRQPRFLAQDTFYQAHRPFKDGKRWDELGLDARLVQVMRKRSGSDYAFLHQSDAIAELLSPEARPVVVTTGTGSGKTECFLLPVIQGAIEDLSRFNRPGLTALLVYPMNALANDQEERIREYLKDSGHTSVRVERYDRTTPQAKRAEMRQRPPHLLLTNYMMLEYLLVRPSDREALFANHRCRYVVLDEVHTYRGSLGSNIALLFRRLRAHLEDAVQDWRADDRTDARRFPTLVPVATSATIKSVDEGGQSAEEVRRLRDAAVQQFVGSLLGLEHGTIRVLGEEKRPLEVPREARWPAQPVDVEMPTGGDSEAARRTLARLAGLPGSTGLREAASSAGILWKLHDLLSSRPMSVESAVAAILDSVPERKGAEAEQVRREVEAAIAAGATLSDEIPGALRLRAHRLVRGGWRFERCVDPACGRLYPQAPDKCECGLTTAPLYLCRSCGAHTLRFKGAEDPSTEQLRRNDGPDKEGEWLLYDMGNLSLMDADDKDFVQGGETDKQMKARPVYSGSFDPATCSFADDPNSYRVRAAVAPSRNTCLVCGFSAGAGSVLTPVGLGTSAAVRVVAEGLVEALADQHRGEAGASDKERLLVFSDSRQDAAHQARFITYAGRYDRMRRRLVRLLEEKGGALSFAEAAKELMARGVEAHDNPRSAGYGKDDFLPAPVRGKALAWEEAPLLDDVSVSAGYRATVFNLGLVGVRYAGLAEKVTRAGSDLGARLGITVAQLLHVARCLLDEMRVGKKAFSRPMLCFHPDSPNCPEEFRAADWERRIKLPNGYACDPDGRPLGNLDKSVVPDGINLNNAWRRAKAGGRGPGLERRFRSLLDRYGSKTEPTEVALLELVAFLMPSWITPSKLYGYRKAATLLQVNAEAVELVLPMPQDRLRCSVCNVRMPWAPIGSPCPVCHGVFEPWPAEEVERNRYVQRVRKPDLLPLVAGEHTAQLTGEARLKLEEEFKAPRSVSPVNILACSPTLEMGIDVGSLDAVVLRNVPPRPDNYAQRGGRAGRRSRVGIVLGYARSTPHDMYFFDRPAEMIAGEVPAPSIGLGNRDVILRHLAAIAFGLAEPGLKGRMMDYIDRQGNLNAESVEELIKALQERAGAAARLAKRAWGSDVLAVAGLDGVEKLEAALGELPDRIRGVFDRVRLQVQQLQKTIEQWQMLGSVSNRSATGAMDLIKRLLGIRDGRGAEAEADDRGSGHPMRRFAEFGILPGYEFPTEPATLQLFGDNDQEETIPVERRFGISQYEPDATVHARGHRWRVRGLDMASPWNPKSPDPTWIYTLCEGCALRFEIQKHVKCPRCGHPSGAQRGMPGYEFGGFLAMRDDTPVLEEEDRFARANRVGIHPQRDGEVVARYDLPCGWRMVLSRGEEVRWVNESRPPSEGESERGVPVLHAEARGFYLCPSCGRTLSWEDTGDGAGKGRKKANVSKDGDPYRHASDCPNLGRPPVPLAIVAKVVATVMRIEVVLPLDMDDERYQQWGQTLGYSIRAGLRHLYMLDGPEIEFCLENMWEVSDDLGKRQAGALTFIDGAVGGSGFVDRAAAELHLVARRALDHLDHEKCETACYRCLKSYNNQRVHEVLRWPLVVGDLEALAEAPPAPVALTAADRQDPRPWLEAFAAGCGSPLEMKFLRLFEQHGIEVEKQVPVAPDEGGAPISTADFVMKGKRVAIYVDGAAFHTGNRLRRDRIIRARLQSGSLRWQVVVAKAKDLTYPSELLAALTADSRE